MQGHNPFLIRYDVNTVCQKKERLRRVVRVYTLVSVSYTHLDVYKRQQYKLRAKQIGRGLNKIGLRLELKAPLTFYVARHSWASIAPVSYTHLN